MPRQWELHQDAVHLWIGVELLDRVYELLLRHALVKLAVYGEKATLVGCLLLHAHVGRRVGSLSDEDDRQTGCDAMLTQ